MYASTVASEVDQTRFSARPRPFSSRCRTRTRGNSAASLVAMARVWSVLALSAIVIRQG